MRGRLAASSAEASCTGFCGGSSSPEASVMAAALPGGAAAGLACAATGCSPAALLSQRSGRLPRGRRGAEQRGRGSRASWLGACGLRHLARRHIDRIVHRRRCAAWLRRRRAGLGGGDLLRRPRRSAAAVRSRCRLAAVVRCPRRIVWPWPAASVERQPGLARPVRTGDLSREGSHRPLAQSRSPAVVVVCDVESAVLMGCRWPPH